MSSWIHFGSHRRGRRLCSGVVLALGLIVAACGTSTEGSSGGDTTPPGTSDIIGLSTSGLDDDGPPVDGGKLVIAVANETDGWNTLRNRWGQWSSVVGSSVLEPLVTLDAHAEPQPWLAESFDANDTYDVWTLKLRDGVSFHNGEPFDAEAVKINLDAVGTSPLTSMVYAGMITETVVIDPLTLEVHLGQPWAAFPGGFLAHQPGLMKAPASLAAEDAGTKHPIGTGPFEFLEWVPSEYFRVTKNLDYWREGEPHLDEIEFRVISDPLSQVNALDAGDVDMYFTFSAQATEDLDPAYSVIRNDETDPTMLVVNSREEIGGTPNPTGNLHARLALAHATDREAVADLIGENVKTMTGPFSPSSPWGQPYEDNGYPEFSVEQAREEVEAYKADTGEDSLVVSLIGSDSPQNNQVLQVLQNQWAEAGIEAKIQNIESTSFIGEMIAGKFQVAMFPIYSTPDPDQLYHFWSSETAKEEGQISINFAHFKSDVIDDAIKIGRENPDVEARKEAYTRAVEELNANAVNLWLFWTPYAVVANERVGGLSALTEVPFANYQPKVWSGRLWVDEDA